MSARDHHPAAANDGTHAASHDDGAVAKQAGGPVAEAAGKGGKHDAEFYKHQVNHFVGDLFNTKVRAIDLFAPALVRSERPPTSILGSAMTFAITAAGGPFVDALALGAAAAVIVKQAIPTFASQVGKTMGSGSDPNPVEVATFATLYGHAINTHRSLMAERLKAAIHDEASGKRVVESLNGHAVGKDLYLTQDQTARLTDQTQRETLDAWTVAMQKLGDKKDHGKQGYSDPSTGQLHLDSLLLHANGKLEAGGAREARMEKVGNPAAKLDGDRRLRTIPVQRTMNVRWEYPGGMSGAFGMSISASGVLREDELGHDDKTAAAMFFDGKSLFPVVSDDVKKDNAIVERDWRKGLHKIWNILNDQTPHSLGFAMKGD
jgi:hypothetical protein